MGKLFRRIFCNMDPVLFLCTLGLSGISILTIVGAVDNFGMSKLKMQIAMTLAGIVISVLISHVDYHFIVDKLWVPMLIFSVGILAITLLFGSSGENRETTNKSWLIIPIVKIGIQPSEIVKITFLCTFARHLYTVRNRINRPLTLLWLGLHAGAVVGLILLSGDLGVAMVYICAIVILLFCAGISMWYYLGAAVALAVAFPWLWNHLEPYQQKRIIVGFNPELDPLDKGQQPLRSRQCIINGGFSGRGLFSGGLYEDLAASHTDFIFATVCEKFGFVGGVAVIGLLLALVIRVLVIASQAKGDYGRFLCIGVAAYIIVQTLENLGMCLAMLPVVGVTLPFISCGGSSMLATYILIAIVHSVQAHKTSSERLS